MSWYAMYRRSELASLEAALPVLRHQRSGSIWSPAAAAAAAAVAAAAAAPAQSAPTASSSRPIRTARFSASVATSTFGSASKASTLRLLSSASSPPSGSSSLSWSGQCTTSQKIARRATHSAVHVGSRARLKRAGRVFPSVARCAIAANWPAIASCKQPALFRAGSVTASAYDGGSIDPSDASTRRLSSIATECILKASRAETGAVPAG
mmetsp:Transcript_11719/g.38529  ORF Transcript_11719/g.38529 Transcript_11719/m.38529 type:complete len:209 (+) Transcript_11719:98-724(+)